MQLKHELQLLMLVTMILMKCTAAVTSRHNSDDSELVKIRRRGPGCVDCPSSGSVPTLDGLRSTPEVKDDDDDFQQLVDADEATQLRRSVDRAGTKTSVDGKRPTDSEHAGRRRQRRSPRPTKTVELAETSLGQLLTLGTDYAERFAFNDPAPRQLEVSAVMGNVLLRDGHRLDYETEPEVEFVVIVTRVDDVACEYIRIFLPW